MLYQLTAWQNVLDILLFAIGLFFLYRTLISLGTWKIVFGILIAALFFIVSSLMGLKGIEWIYRNVSHVAVLSLVVLFQPELRKIFERTASLRRTKDRTRSMRFSGILAESLWQMAEKGIGALIVIPGQEPIKEWIKGGFPLNGEPSKPLILSIFDPNSPGHDGALILEGGLFTAFGVRLPVSQSGRLQDDYGTRHQSAMGLCEKSDALVAVVSEERRQVSLFKEGQMQAMPSQAEMIRKIADHCRDTGFFDRLKHRAGPAKHLWFEISASILVAGALWFSIIAGQGEMLEKVISVPVEYTATSEDLVMTGKKAKEVRLHLAGSKSDLDAISPGATSVKINLENAGVGEQTVIISKDNIRLPRGVRLLDVDPGSLSVTIERLVKVFLPVKPQVVGALPKHLTLKSVIVNPEMIEVFIPSGKAGETHKHLTTTPIYLEWIQESTRLYCKIVSSPAIQPVDKRWPDVEVSLDIQSLRKKSD